MDIDGKSMLGYAASGLALGAGAAAIYNILKTITTPPKPKIEKFPELKKLTTSLPIKEIEKEANFLSYIPILGPALDKFTGEKPVDQSVQLAGDLGGFSLGGYAGFRLVDSLMDDERKKERKARIAKAREKYLKAMKAYIHMSKSSSYEFDEILDDITDITLQDMEKSASRAPLAYIGAAGILFTIWSYLKRRQEIKDEEAAKVETALSALDSLHKQKAMSQVPQFSSESFEYENDDVIDVTPKTEEKDETD
jgi:hypothetical protein